jgi:hypothetical protein
MCACRAQLAVTAEYRNDMTVVSRLHQAMHTLLRHDMPCSCVFTSACMHVQSNTHHHCYQRWPHAHARGAHGMQ